MGHINAGLEWLIQVFNEMWPLILATFIGAWLAFQNIKYHERRKETSERARIGEYTYFVLASQADRLQRLKLETLDPYEDHARRAMLVDAVVFHDDFPKLSMDDLPLIFDEKSYNIMNQVIEAEQGFLEIARLLKQRVHALDLLESAEGHSDESKQHKASLRKNIGMITDRIYLITHELLARRNKLQSKIKDHIQPHPERKHVDLVDYFSWMFLAAACAVVGVFFFSHWAVSSTAMINMGLDISLVSALVFAFSLYASLALCFIVFIIGIYALFKHLKSVAVYFWTLLISVQPMLFLLWLDAA